jgi:hypothetical protein
LDEVRKCFREAAQLAALAAPYRHARLSAVKHIDNQADSIDGIRADASPEEVRAKIAKRVVMLAEKGYVDLEALPRAHMNKEGVIADEEDQKGSD